ncbi:MAG TPA: L-histidine N(alpha)-methyltransferase [Alphaproteobacteria bacterium]|nr:L-histidine N(alpha)-methyltransferase [Alphaproteobacteria bacterium]
MPMTRRPHPLSAPPRDRLVWRRLLDAATLAEGEREIIAGLTAAPKRLPCRLFYDERGSQLFERICELPEYYLTRTERALLGDIADAMARQTGPCDIVELGSGTSSKTQVILDAYGAAGAPLRYAAIDVSESSLREGTAALLARYPSLAAQAIVGTYELGLAALADGASPSDASGRPRLVLFLGSTIGNLDPEETARFLARLRASLRPGDYFLVGTDLDKDPAVIEAAYNDAEGVTAAFNLNMLRHVNWRFRGDFALDRYAHIAVYNREKRQIEMRLRSLAAQTVQLAGLALEIRLAAGEAIETEISRKFVLAEFGAALEAARFAVAAQWTDAQRWFGLTLARAV